MSDIAYAVMFVSPSLDGSPASVVGAGVFGEPTPTTSSRIIPVELFNVRAADFASASHLAGERLAEPFYDWLGELRTDTHRGNYRDARRAK